MHSKFEQIRGLCSAKTTHAQILEIQHQTTLAIEPLGTEAAETLLPYVLKELNTVPSTVLFSSVTSDRHGIEFLFAMHRHAHLDWFTSSKEALYYLHRLMIFLSDSYQFMHGWSRWSAPSAHSDRRAISSNLQALYDDFHGGLTNNHYGLLGYIIHLSALAQVSHEQKMQRLIHEPDDIRQSPRWSTLTALLEQRIQRSLRPTDGLFRTELNQIKTDSGDRLPLCLVEYHQSFGRLESFGDHVMPLALVAKKHCTKALIPFMVENQGVVAWAVEAGGSTGDVQVYCLHESVSNNHDIAHQFKAPDLPEHWQVATRTDLRFSQFMLNIFQTPYQMQNHDPSSDFPF